MKVNSINLTRYIQTNSQNSKKNSVNFTANPLDFEKIALQTVTNNKVAGTTGWLISDMEGKISKMVSSKKAPKNLQDEFHRATELWVDATDRINMFNNFVENNDTLFLSDAIENASINSSVEIKRASDIAREKCNIAFADKSKAEKLLAEINKKISDLNV